MDTYKNRNHRQMYIFTFVDLKLWDLTTNLDAKLKVNGSFMLFAIKQ